MGLLLPIFTRSLIGNNGFIITYYEPDQLADVAPPGARAAPWACLRLSSPTASYPAPDCSHLSNPCLTAPQVPTARPVPAPVEVVPNLLRGTEGVLTGAMTGLKPPPPLNGLCANRVLT
jgi:hypothetical protein